MQKETLETQNSLIYHSEYGGDSEIQLEVQQYANNGRIAISMLTNEEGYPEHYGSHYLQSNLCLYNITVLVDNGKGCIL